MVVVCNTGARSYEALVTLHDEGFRDVVSIQGGMTALTNYGSAPWHGVQYQTVPDENRGPFSLACLFCPDPRRRRVRLAASAGYFPARIVITRSITSCRTALSTGLAM